MQQLVDFLNHGSLPFAGRDSVLERIMRFWRDTSESSELRLLLLLGEAGIGKSRLIEEVLPRVHHEGGLAVHTKLVPETSGSIAPLLARSLWNSESSRFLLRSTPEENRGGVLAALRRLARLRPVMLVIEDAHLLGGETLRELGSLLEGLSDESLAVICAARPLNEGLHDVVAPYLSQRVELEGLDSMELGDLWQRVFGAQCEGSSLASLVDVTAGNPLAIRSALRGAVASGAIEPIGADAPQRVRVDRNRFVQEVRRNAGRIGSGMAVHLTAEEQSAARVLAQLGEAFARETAMALLDDNGAMLERLTFRGILKVLSTPMMPIIGMEREVPEYPASAFPLLSFTHTLLHRHFLEAGDGSASTAVARVMAADLPLYSFLPIQVITGGTPPELTGSEAMNLLKRIRYLAHELLTLGDMQRGGELVQGLRRLFHSFAPVLDAEGHRSMIFTLLLLAIELDWYNENPSETEPAAAELLAMTKNPQNTEEAARRITALGKVYRDMVHDRQLRLDTWKVERELVEQFPDVRFTQTYALSLTMIAGYALDEGDLKTVRESEAELHEIGRHPEGARLAAYLQGGLGPLLLNVFETPEELQERLEQMERLDAMINIPLQRIEFLDQQMCLFNKIGLPDRALEVIEIGLPAFRQADYQAIVCRAFVIRLYAHSALGLNLEEIRQEALRFPSEIPQRTQRYCRGEIGGNLPEAGMLRGDTDWTRAMVATFPEGAKRTESEVPLWLALDADSVDDIPDEVDRSMVQCAAMMRSGDLNGAAYAVADLLGKPVLRLLDILRLHLALALAARTDGSSDPALKRRLVEALGRALEWLAERRLAAYMTPLLDRADGYLTVRQIRAWRTRAATIQRQRDAQRGSSSKDDRIKITMFGTIEVLMPEGEAQRITGARIKTVLGLIVAASIADRPLSHREFCSIATGEEDHERARNTVYVRLHALRELLGADAIITEAEEAPRLHLKRVYVDLLDAYESLRDARDAAGEGALMRAVPALLKALALSRGEVAFPGLYEEFFEAAREDFENLLRNTLLRVSSDLLREGDAENAERILRRGFEAMADDEEIAELFRDALTRRGRRAEAERVLRASAEMARA